MRNVTAVKQHANKLSRSAVLTRARQEFAKALVLSRFHHCSIMQERATFSNDFFFRQLFDDVSCTYTYLLGDVESKEAVLIDPGYWMLWKPLLSNEFHSDLDFQFWKKRREMRRWLKSWALNWNSLWILIVMLITLLVLVTSSSCFLVPWVSLERMLVPMLTVGLMTVRRLSSDVTS